MKANQEGYHVDFVPDEEPVLHQVRPTNMIAFLIVLHQVQSQHDSLFDCPSSGMLTLYLMKNSQEGYHVDVECT
jgi:hypothetical protein